MPRARDAFRRRLLHAALGGLTALGAVPGVAFARRAAPPTVSALAVRAAKPFAGDRLLFVTIAPGVEDAISRRVQFSLDRRARVRLTPCGWASIAATSSLDERGDVRAGPSPWRGVLQRTRLSAPTSCADGGGERRSTGLRRTAAPDAGARLCAGRPSARRRGGSHAALLSRLCPRSRWHCVYRRMLRPSRHVPARRPRPRPEAAQRRDDRPPDGRPGDDRSDRQAPDPAHNRRAVGRLAERPL